jgi:FkbM family methyltransferase
MSKTFARILASTISLLTNMQRAERGERNRLLLRDLLTEKHSIETSRGLISLVCNSASEVHYAHHFFDREPSALRWIESFEGPCTFWDVGANIGIYSLFAALKRNVKVYAYEPSASSHAALYTNISANSLDDQVVALCLGFFEKTELGRLYMSTVQAGAAMHQFGDLEGSSLDDGNKKYMQHVITFTIDQFRKLFKLQVPTYLKIDVDGVEREILYGASETLRDENIRSILIEMSVSNPIKNKNIINFLGDYNYRIKSELSEGENVVFSR